MYYESPVGLLRINVSDAFIKGIVYLNDGAEMNNDDAEENLSEEDQAVFIECQAQLDEYFSGDRKIFELTINQTGTAFQQTVWNELLNIPFGKTISYLQLSRRIGNVKSIRAAGTANGRNNLSIVVPCHRVIGADGSLTGYVGGLWRKQWLLEHESKYASGVQLLF